MLDDGLRISEPLADRAVLKPAVGAAMAGIIKPDEGAAFRFGPKGERLGFG